MEQIASGRGKPRIHRASGRERSGLELEQQQGRDLLWSTFFPVTTSLPARPWGLGPGRLSRECDHQKYLRDLVSLQMETDVVCILSKKIHLLDLSGLQTAPCPRRARPSGPLTCAHFNTPGGKDVVEVAVFAPLGK